LTSACECGLLKLKTAEACFRCLSIDERPSTTEGLILDAMADFASATFKDLVERTRRTQRTIWRAILPLVKTGRLRSWLADQDIEPWVHEPTAGTHIRRFHQRASAPVRTFRRVW
jgi:hypothetical protein